jgi:hypothetical protein
MMVKVWMDEFMEDRKQRVKKELSTGVTFKVTLPSDLLFPTRPHLLKFLEAPKIMLPGGEQVFNTRTYDVYFVFKP